MSEGFAYDLPHGLQLANFPGQANADSLCMQQEPVLASGKEKGLLKA